LTNVIVCNIFRKDVNVDWLKITEDKLSNAEPILQTQG